LLEYAESLKPNNMLVFNKGIELTNLFLKYNIGGNTRGAVTNKFNYYVTKIKNIDPNYKAPTPGCFIATAVTGSFNHPDVLQLRRFRDNYLLNRKIGQMVVKVYYIYSPTFAEKIKNKKALKGILHIWLIKPIATITKIFNQ
jgi:hypothetical protein